MTGVKASCNRPKVAKHLRTAGSKKFRNEDPEAKARYALKINLRTQRKINKKKRGIK